MYNWIYAHRGIWDSSSEMNSKRAIDAAKAGGFSIETDIRDFSQTIVISHDPVVCENRLTLNQVLDSQYSFALNIKSDGLLKLLEPFHDLIKNSNSFLFDGSIPEMIKYKNSGLPYALRLSEYEKTLSWNADVIWVDGFHSDWWLDSPSIEVILQTKKVVLVSPEIHGRDYRRTWDWILEKRNLGHENLCICTDFAQELKDQL